jgi:hypothetical protein
VFGGQSNTVPPLSNSVTQHVRRVVNAAVEGNKKAWDTARRKVSEARKVQQISAAAPTVTSSTAASDRDEASLATSMSLAVTPRTTPQHGPRGSPQVSPQSMRDALPLTAAALSSQQAVHAPEATAADADRDSRASAKKGPGAVGDPLTSTSQASSAGSSPLGSFTNPFSFRLIFKFV